MPIAISAHTVTHPSGMQAEHITFIDTLHNQRTAMGFLLPHSTLYEGDHVLPSVFLSPPGV